MMQVVRKVVFGVRSLANNKDEMGASLGAVRLATVAHRGTDQ